MSSSELENSSHQTGDVVINIRATQSQRDLIDRVAQIMGKSRSEFMLESAYQKAQDALLDLSFFGLDEQKFQEFVALLDAPPRVNQKLHHLLSTPSPWD